MTIPHDAQLKGQPDFRYQPLWCRRLAGRGHVQLGRTALRLSSNDRVPRDEFTVLALDDDPDRRWFDFAVELFPSQGGPPTPRAGLFFGWRTLEDGGAAAYFVELDDKPDAGPQAVRVGYLTLPAVADGKAAHDAPLVGLPAAAVAEAIVLDAAPPRYRIIVQARPHGVAVRVNDRSAVPIAVGADARGSLGIWVRRGTHWFSGATIRALPL